MPERTIVERCRNCNGSGQRLVREERTGPFTTKRVFEPCSECDGKGKGERRVGSEISCDHQRFAAVDAIGEISGEELRERRNAFSDAFDQP